jgi:hypothetical protein
MSEGDYVAPLWMRGKAGKVLHFEQKHQTASISANTEGYIFNSTVLFIN